VETYEYPLADKFKILQKTGIHGAGVFYEIIAQLLLKSGNYYEPRHVHDEVRGYIKHF
jgi:hypothetical protein